MATAEAPLSFEHLHAAVLAQGTPEERAYAEELAKGHRNVGIGLEVSLKLHRDAMAKLLETIEARRFAEAAGE